MTTGRINQVASPFRPIGPTSGPNDRPNIDNSLALKAIESSEFCYLCDNSAK